MKCFIIQNHYLHALSVQSMVAAEAFNNTGRPSSTSRYYQDLLDLRHITGVHYTSNF